MANDEITASARAEIEIVGGDRARGRIYLGAGPRPATVVEIRSAAGDWASASEALIVCLEALIVATREVLTRTGIPVRPSIQVPIYRRGGLPS